MSLTNSNNSYGWISIALHWLSALIVFFLFGLGLYMVELSYYDAWYKDSLDLHKSIGLSFVALWLFRVIWKLGNAKVQPIPGSGRYEKLEKLAAKLVHILLYLILSLLFISGFLISTADGRGIEVFGLLEVPALPWAFDNQEDLAGDVHWVLAWTLITLVSLHAVAVLKHHFVDKDHTLTRMLKPTAK